jgi:hypothetical protein
MTLLTEYYVSDAQSAPIFSHPSSLLPDPKPNEIIPVILNSSFPPSSTTYNSTIRINQDVQANFHLPCRPCYRTGFRPYLTEWYVSTDCMHCSDPSHVTAMNC